MSPGLAEVAEVAVTRGLVCVVAFFVIRFAAAFFESAFFESAFFEVGFAVDVARVVFFAGTVSSFRGS
jgi:hypothetical protein